MRKAAQLGYDRAQYNMGLILEKGQIIDKDLKEAAKFYEQAAKKGNSKAQCNYAAMLAAGEGVEKDEEPEVIGAKAQQSDKTLADFDDKREWDTS